MLQFNMKTINKLTAAICGTVLAGGMLLSSCTDSFKEMALDPNEATREQMDQDNLMTGSFFTQMLRSTFVVGQDQGGTYQIEEMLQGGNFAGYFASIKDSYNVVGNRHADHYNMQNHWYNMPFNNAYTGIMQPWAEICKVTIETGVDRALATVVKVLAMQRITDKYGPIPYSKFGTDIHVAYDSQEQVYNQFFEELDNAITVLTDYTAANSAAYMAKYDYVYAGDVNKWLKLANTLRLRLAMRVSYVDEALARTNIQKALDCGRFLSSASDNAYIQNAGKFTYTNPIWEVCSSFGDMCMSATMEAYLVGLNDPRLAAYFLPATSDGAYHGMRNGMTSYFTSMPGKVSIPNVEAESAIAWMNYAEPLFLKAEAKLRFGLGDEEVKDLYEAGIRASMATAGVTSGVDAYIADATSVPSTTWINVAQSNRSTNIASMVSALTVAWDDAASNDQKLERLMTQKWIALYPNGTEAWAEMRRTGYPGWVRINSYSYADGVASNEMISRLRFPSTEYSDNGANVQDALTLLGGQDNAGTRLWWDVNR